MAATTMQQSAPTREQIEQRAYELYLKRGGEHGSDLADWLAAERELMGSLVEQKKAPQKRSTSAAG